MSAALLEEETVAVVTLTCASVAEHVCLCEGGMSAVKSLVPARFLTLAAHLVVIITIFWSRENNIRSCLPLDFTEEQFRTEDTRLVVALSVTLALFVIELAGFLSGGSMFNSNQAVLSLVAHSSASVSLSFFVFQQWPCWTYWIIFSLCSVFPALFEFILLISLKSV
ncbi:transmembrane protein 107 [Chanodichthys erythropterus]|uniref:transmembrane protein 107 n=1 Tax=Chanodichthys erythropterus TaxID=933992 RepID=UPI00351EF222